MLDYNVPGGKLNRGMAVADALVVIKGKQVGCAQCLLVDDRFMGQALFPCGGSGF